MTRKDEILKHAYVERDVSWMYFNHRILQEACKKQVPLLERLSFLGIYSNNLDEFFRVRVASLNRMLSGNSSREQAKNIKKTLKTIIGLNETYAREYTAAVAEVFHALKQHKIQVLTENELNAEQKAFLTHFFYDKLNGAVNPLWLNELDDLSGKTTASISWWRWRKNCAWNPWKSPRARSAANCARNTPSCRSRTAPTDAGCRSRPATASRTSCIWTT